VGDSGPPWRDREMPRRHLQLLRAPPGECEARCKTDDKQKAPVHTRIARAHRIAIRQSAWLSAVPDTRGHRHRDANARRCGICAAHRSHLGWVPSRHHSGADTAVWESAWLRAIPCYARGQAQRDGNVRRWPTLKPNPIRPRVTAMGGGRSPGGTSDTPGAVERDSGLSGYRKPVTRDVVGVVRPSPESNSASFGAFCRLLRPCRSSPQKTTLTPDRA
jgi:hypothetical protein